MTEADYVSYGNPVEQLAEEESLSQYASQNQLKAQKVKDKQGRERFHGAFTGGFSAGYYNTVGSKEGWTPATYVSSRREKDGQGQRPEDFMDDEDLEQFGIAPREIKASDEYGRQPQTAERAAWDPVVPGLTQALTKAIRPVHASVAVKLLSMMGWKHGQGIGPRMKRRARQQRGINTIGPTLPPDMMQATSDDGESEDEEFVKNVTFAPKDLNPINFQVKDDLHGIGYRPLQVPHDGMSSKREEERLTFGGHSKGISGRAFGVGIEEDDDDDDIYTTAKVSSYDSSLTDEPEDYHNFTKPRSHERRQQAFPSSSRLLDGFCLAQKKDKMAEKYRAPALPKAYRPKCPIVAPSELPKLSGKLDRSVRALIIGESLPDLSKRSQGEGQPSLLPGKSVEISLNQTPVKLSEQTEAEMKPPPRPQQPLNKQGIEFKPFAKNAEKQLRYERYLTFTQSGDRDAYGKVAPAEFTRGEKEREREEFERSGKFFKNLSGVMANRFTRSKTNLDDDDDQKVTIRVDEETAGLLDDKKQAVEMKLFGNLTRESYEWHPHRLMCKRFNVPNPYPDSQLVGLPVITKDKISAYNFLDIEALTSTPDELKAKKMVEAERADASRTATQQPSSSQPETPSSTVKAPVDLFKAVFQDSGSDSDTSDDEEKQEDTTPELANKSEASDRPEKVLSSAGAQSDGNSCSVRELYSRGRQTSSMYETSTGSTSTADNQQPVKVQFVPKAKRMGAKSNDRKTRWAPMEEVHDTSDQDGLVNESTTKQDGDGYGVATVADSKPDGSNENTDVTDNPVLQQVVERDSEKCNTDTVTSEDRSSEHESTVDRRPNQPVDTIPQSTSPPSNKIKDDILSSHELPNRVKDDIPSSHQPGSDEDVWMPSLPPSLSLKQSNDDRNPSSKDKGSDSGSDRESKSHKKNKKKKSHKKANHKDKHKKSKKHR